MDKYREYREEIERLKGKYRDEIEKLKDEHIRETGKPEPVHNEEEEVRKIHKLAIGTLVVCWVLGMTAMLASKKATVAIVLAFLFLAPIWWAYVIRRASKVKSLWQMSRYDSDDGYISVAGLNPASSFWILNDD